jgi:2-polyprenyl-3-methyl-5-hydroxy-6-metoxy-1,4-benzoquinol methylase
MTVENTVNENFSEKLIRILNDGSVSLMISIGHKTGLFDVLSRFSSPESLENIAKASNLNERYVKEWLGCMVVGKIIEYDSINQKYYLPLEHSEYLTRSAGLDNLAVFFQYISLLGNVEDKIVDCFRNGGGIPYSEYPRFQELQAEETSRIFDARLLTDIIPLVNGLTSDLKTGINVLDVGCGRGHALNIMAEAFPSSRFYGYDISKEGIDAAAKESAKKGLSNVFFEVKDASSINEISRFDLVTAFDAIHDQSKPTEVLKAIFMSLKSNGTFLMQDIAASSNLHENASNLLAPTLYTFSTMHCMTVSLAHHGEGLGTMWGKQLAEQKLREAGFNETIETYKVPGDMLNYYYVARKA